MTTSKRHKIILREVNKHLVCRLCRGYYIDATTIAECLHSFCRSCIIKHLERNSFCPICEVQIHRTRPYLNLRLDKALQDVVYKLVPGLYHDEMDRRRRFYEDKPDIAVHTSPERRGVEERLIFSPDYIISLSLEFIDCPEPEPDPVPTQSSDNGEDFPLQLGLMKVRRGDTSARKESTDSNEPGQYPKQFLNCPAGLSIRLLKKFLTQKFEFSSNMEFEILYKRVPLPEHYTLMDVAYIFTWKRMEPMRLFYQIIQKIPVKKSEKQQTAPVQKPVETVKPAQEVAKPNPQVKPTECIEKKDTVNVKKPECVKTIPVKRPAELPIPTGNAKKPTENLPKTPVEKKQNEIAPKKLADSLLKKNGETLKRPRENKPLEETKKVPYTPVPANKENPPKVDKQPETEIIKTDLKTSSPEVTKPKPKMIRLPLKVPPNPQITFSKKSPEPSIPKLPSPVLNKSPEPSIPHPKIPSPLTAEPKELQKLLLNPISGQLESEAKKNVKSSVQQLKTFRKEKNSGKANALTITTAPIKDKPSPKEEASVSIEIKTDGKSEYDFESSSPPNRIMSLHEYTQSEVYKTKYSKMNGTMNLQDFRQQVLNGKPNGEECKKNKDVPSLYRISEKKAKPKEEPARVINIKTPEPKLSSPPPPLKNKPDTEGDAEILRQLLKRRDTVQKEKRLKSLSPKSAAVNSSKDLEPKLDLKKDQAMLEMLVSVAQKQSIEPLLKVPQFPQGSKPASQISQNDIRQALKFFQKLSSDIDAKTQVEQSVPPKPPSMLQLQQYYMKQIEFIRMLKRQQAMTNEVTAKLPKADDKKQTKKPEEAALKSMDRTLSQIQEQAEIQRRLVIQNCKNFPPLLQYFNNTLFREQNPQQNGAKSPLTPEEQQLLASQQQMFTTGITSDMSFHQMFQQYLSQQLKMNQRKPVKRPGSPSPRLGSPPEKKPTLAKLNENNNAQQKSPVASVSKQVTDGPEKSVPTGTAPKPPAAST